MTLEARARRAGREFRHAVDGFDRFAPERRSIGRFDRYRGRRRLEQRIGVIVLASIVAIVSLVFVAHAIPRAEQPATPPVVNGQIVFVRHDPRSGEPVVFSMNPDGSDLTQMFFSGFFSGHSEWPHWSPDGSRVAIFCCDDGMSPQIVDPDTGALSEVVPARPGLGQYCGFAWSPDGTRLACGNIGSKHGDRTGVWTIRPDGSGLEQVTSYPRGEDGPGDFSPDGERLVFARRDRSGRPIGIFVVNVDGGTPTRITPAGMNLDWFGGSWSPAGDQILLVASKDRRHHRTIWDVGADGTGMHQVPIPGCGGLLADPSSVDCTYPGWSPDGTKIVFTRSSHDGKATNIAVVNADGSGLVQITNTGDADEADWGAQPIAP